jgi:hypothetical protein
VRPWPSIDANGYGFGLRLVVIKSTTGDDRPGWHITQVASVAPVVAVVRAAMLTRSIWVRPPQRPIRPSWG